MTCTLSPGHSKLSRAFLLAAIMGSTTSFSAVGFTPSSRHMLSPAYSTTTVFFDASKNSGTSSPAIRTRDTTSLKALSPRVSFRKSSNRTSLTKKSLRSKVVPTLGAILCSVFFWSRQTPSAMAAIFERFTHTAVTNTATSSIATAPAAAATLSQVGTAAALVYYTSVVAMKKTTSPHLANTLGKSILQVCGRNIAKLYFMASLILSPVLASKHPLITAAYLALTGGLATHHATQQLEYSYKGLKSQMFISIIGAFSLTIGASWGLDLMPGKTLAQTWIPLAGLIFGHTATSAANAANTWTRELCQQRDSWEWRVARGATWKEAAAPLIETSYRAAWTPLMSALTMSMGLWQLPTLMSGHLMASTTLSATQVAMQQIIVWCLTATTVSTAVQGIMQFMMRSTVNVEDERLRLGTDKAPLIQPVDLKDPWWNRARSAVSKRISNRKESTKESKVQTLTSTPLDERNGLSVMFGAKSEQTLIDQTERHFMNGGTMSADDNLDELNIFEDNNSHLKFFPGWNEHKEENDTHEEGDDSLKLDDNDFGYGFQFAGVGDFDPTEDSHDLVNDSVDNSEHAHQSASSLLKLERSVFANGPAMARYHRNLKKEESKIAEDYGVYNPLVLKLDEMPVDRAQVSISFQVHARDIIGINGPSGIGKSQFLRTVAGLENMERTTVSIFGQSAAEMTMAQWRKNVAYVPHKVPTSLEGTPADFFEQTLGFASQKIGSGMNAKSLAKMDLSTLLSNWGLDPEIIHHPWASLSSDEAQRISLAISVALKPAVLLLDDCLSSMNEDITLTMENSIRALQIPIMMISNDQDQITRMCNHVIDLAPAIPASFSSSEGFE